MSFRFNLFFKSSFAYCLMCRAVHSVAVNPSCCCLVLQTLPPDWTARGAALNNGPYILPECGGSATDKPFLSGSPERESTAAHVFDFVARRLHQLQKGGKIGGLLQEGRVDPRPQSFLKSGRFVVPEPFPVILILPLAPRLWILHNRKPVFQTNPVTYTPNSKGAVPEVPKLPGAVQRR